MITKTHIISEIVRTAKANEGVPLGRARFFTETGIKETDWLGKFWARWGDAIVEAGLTPNTLQGGYPEEQLLERLASFTREIGRFPTSREIQLKVRSDKGFPNPKTFQHLGKKRELAAILAKFCESRPEYLDVRPLCEPLLKESPDELDDESATAAPEAFGYVYLLKSGRFFKIGRTNAVGRRERELVIQMPEKARTVHSIKTDDPGGIEEYWHRRFTDRRKNGEWFELTSRDVAAFKRRKFM